MEAIDWIGSNPDGSPKGMNAQVINDEADLCIASTYPYSDTKLIFLHPIQTADLYAFFVQPTGFNMQNIFFRPFDLQVWIFVIVVWTVAALTIIITVHIKKLIGNVSFEDQYMFDGAIFWVLSSVASKGWIYTPESLSLKLVMLSGLLLSFLTLTVYTSSLISFFSVEVKPILNFGDVLKLGFTIYAGGYRTVTEYAISNIKNIKTGKSKLAEENAANAIAEVLKSSSAFVGIAEELYGVIQNNKTLEEQEDRIDNVVVSTVKTKAGAFVKRGSHFKEFFNYKIISLFENGIRFRLMQQSSRTLSGTHHKDNLFLDYSLTEITLTDSIIPFLIFAIGLLLSIMVLVIEKLPIIQKKFE